MKRILIVSILAAVIVSCSKEEKKAERVDEIPVVEVASVQSMQPSMVVVLPGELKPWNKTSLHAKIRGYVGSVLVDRGSVVKKGQLMAVLEAPEIVAALNQAKAQLSSAEATLIEQRTKKKISTTTYHRILETSKTAGAISANELDVAHARMMSDSALSRAAEENLRAATAQVASQEQLVQYLSVRAPFDGNVTERNVSPGDLVGPDGGAKPIFVLEDRSKLRLTIAVPENLSNAVEENSVVSFTIEADPLKEYQANFARSSNSLQEHNRTMLAEYDYVNTKADLKAGMYAEVKIPIKRNRPTMFVPRTSVLTSTEGVFVLKVNDNIAEWVSVRKGNSADSLVEVFGPVAVGDRVVRHANEELRNGQSVKSK
ncbi:MAG TPA: efflux RND transporter periplasmic adaptor subunit [Cyclobacteriaceae bacterium]|nr:efflux RND transporter periplasmic adaptor subunit [Cyclobacteriaceae bacterium]